MNLGFKCWPKIGKLHSGINKALELLLQQALFGSKTNACISVFRNFYEKPLTQSNLSQTQIIHITIVLLLNFKSKSLSV